MIQFFEGLQTLGRQFSQYIFLCLVLNNNLELFANPSGVSKIWEIKVHTVTIHVNGRQLIEYVEHN